MLRILSCILFQQVCKQIVIRINPLFLSFALLPIAGECILRDDVCECRKPCVDTKARRLTLFPDFVSLKTAMACATG